LESLEPAGLSDNEDIRRPLNSVLERNHRALRGGYQRRQPAQYRSNKAQKSNFA
jgi:hypothetical protein